MISGARAGRKRARGVSPAFFCCTATLGELVAAVTLWQALRSRARFRAYAECLLARCDELYATGRYTTALESTEGQGPPPFFCKRLETGSTGFTRPSVVADALHIIARRNASVLTH